MVEISKSQDIEAGDGTTSVVVIAGALLNACQTLLEKGIHASAISTGLQVALDKALEVIDEMSIPVDLNDRESLIQNATFYTTPTPLINLAILIRTRHRLHLLSHLFKI